MYSYTCPKCHVINRHGPCGCTRPDAPRSVNMMFATVSWRRAAAASERKHKRKALLFMAFCKRVFPRDVGVLIGKEMLRVPWVEKMTEYYGPETRLVCQKRVPLYAELPGSLVYRFKRVRVGFPVEDPCTGGFTGEDAVLQLPGFVPHTMQGPSVLYRSGTDLRPAELLTRGVDPRAIRVCILRDGLFGDRYLPADKIGGASHDPFTLIFGVDDEQLEVGLPRGRNY